MTSSNGFSNFRTKVLAAFISVYLISWLSILGATYFNLQEQRTLAQEEVQQRFLQIYTEELNGYKNALSASLDTLTHPSRINHDFTLANKPHFLTDFEADYNTLNQRLSVTHFYFSTRERQNIARLHATERSGDIINRATTLEAENNKEITSGVELGRLGSLTFRVVKPLYTNDQLHGFVEVGRELRDIWQKAAQQLDISVQVLVRKNLLHEKDWHEGKQVFGYQSNWNTLQNYVQIGGETDNPHMQEVMKAAYEAQKHSLVDQVSIEGEVFLYSAIPLVDFSNNTIGTILFAYPQNLLAGNLLEDLGGAASASAIALLFGLAICYILLSPVARSMQNQQMVLQKKFDHRTQALFVAKEEAIQAKNDAEIANKAKSEFLSNMSHELRTPLNAIIGFSSILKNDELAEGIGEKYSGYAHDIHASGTHLLDIINDILDVSRIEAGEMELRYQYLSVSKLMHECHRMVNVRATGRSVPVIHVSYGNDMMIDADATRLKQILINLLTNAIKFTVPPGVVRFSAERAEGNTVRFIVEDEGIGIPKKEQENVLRRFGKAASNALSRQSEEGTGLGLTLVQDLIKQHGGEFTFDSEPGKGTRVTFTLPMEHEGDEDPDII